MGFGQAAQVHFFELGYMKSGAQRLGLSVQRLHWEWLRFSKSGQVLNPQLALKIQLLIWCDLEFVSMQKLYHFKHSGIK